MSNDKIPTDEIKNDIADTLHEITQMKREEQGFRLIGDKMSLFRANARRDGIVERKVFIEKLEGILKERGES